MQHTKTRELFLSLDQPDKTLHVLLTLFQEIHDTTSSKGITLTSLHAHTVLVLDSDNQRVRHITYLLSSVGYRPCIAANALEAFTLFLRGSFVPFVILLGQNDTNNRFFLSRLLQQIKQKHSWDTPLVSLRTLTPMQTTQHTEPLPTSPQPYTEFSPVLQPMHPLTSTHLTSSLALIPQTPQRPFSEPSQIVQTPFPMVPSSSTLPARLADVAPIINVSTHDIQKERNVAQRISLEGQSIGRYHLKTLVGDGPLGQVYQTYDRLREQDVAMKTIQMNALPREMDITIANETNFFQQEIDVLRTLDHPHIMSPLNCGKSYISGAPFVYKTMPFCTDGSVATLFHQLRLARLLSPQEVIPIIVQIADALQHAHDHNITYQNFKLSNFLIRTRKKGRGDIHVLLTDFAVAQNASFLTKTPDIFPYMAPERWYGQSLPASDQYGLAAVAYELLSGRTLFQGRSEKIMRQLHTNMTPQPLTLFTPHVSTTLSNIILRALSKKVENRFPSVRDFAQALQRKSNKHAQTH